MKIFKTIANAVFFQPGSRASKEMPKAVTGFNIPSLKRETEMEKAIRQYIDKCKTQESELRLNLEALFKDIETCSKTSTRFDRLKIQNKLNELDSEMMNYPMTAIKMTVTEVIATTAARQQHHKTIMELIQNALAMIHREMGAVIAEKKSVGPDEILERFGMGGV